MTAILLTLVFLFAEQVSAYDQCRDSLAQDGRNKVTWGVDLGRFKVSEEICGCLGPWIAISVGHGIRLGARLYLPGLSMEPTYMFIPEDSVAFDWLEFSSLRLDLSYEKLEKWRISWPVGIMVGYEVVHHDFRRLPYASAVTESDSYPILEPWVGMRHAPLKNPYGWNVLLRVFSLAIGYRIPIGLDLHGSHWHDNTATVVYLRIHIR